MRWRAAGAVCVPLDPGLPPKLTEARLAQAEAVAVIGAPASGLGIAGRPAVDVGGTADAPPERAVSPADPAFIFFTSGSTGTAMAVVVSHLAAAAGQLPDAVPYALGEEDRFMLTTSPGSVRLIGEIFWPAAAGARVVVPDEGELLGSAEYADIIRDQGVTVFATVPSMLGALAEGLEPGACPSVRLVLALGEPLPRYLLGEFGRAFPHATLLNSYAQTEACPAVFWPCTSADRGLFAPVGVPGPVSAAYVLDANLEPAPVGIAGEIYIGDLTVASGYLGDPAGHEGKFVADPFSDLPNARMFRTGDQGRWLESGALDFISRLEDRLKVRGHSVVPAEVEARLCEMSEIGEAAVVAPGGGGTSDRLVAYAVPRPGAQIDAISVREKAAAILPEYMIPAEVIAVPSLPRTGTGKIDRLALQDCYSGRADPEAEVPTTETERTALRIWSDVMGTEVGLHESFYDLGGNSLQGIRITSRLSRALDIKVPLSVLFDGRTVAGMARLIADARGEHP